MTKGGDTASCSVRASRRGRWQYGRGIGGLPMQGVPPGKSFSISRTQLILSLVRKALDARASRMQRIGAPWWCSG